MRVIDSQAEIALKGMVLLTIVAILAGCGGGTGNSGGTNTGGSSSGGTVAPSPASSFYIVEQGIPPEPSKILQFSRTANGSVTPVSTITGPAGVGFTALTVDGLGNLYVGGQEFSGSTDISPEILVYAPGASGTATPSQAITAGLQSPSANSISALAVDNVQNLYVVTAAELGSGPTGRVYTGIVVYAPAANGGKLATTKSIVGPATEISNNPDQVATDSAGNLYVASGSTATGPGSIVIFNSSATGNMPPTSTLTGPNTTIGYAQGVAVDSAGNIYVSSAAQLPQSIEDGAPSILKFSAGSTGNVAPVQIISGSATTMENIGNLRVDSAGNIYVLSGSQVLRFAPGASGNVAPAATISSSAFTGADGPIAVQ
jgi:hypothetical protein